MDGHPFCSKLLYLMTHGEKLFGDIWSIFKVSLSSVKTYLITLHAEH